MSNSYSLPPILVMQIEALVDSGHFSSRSDVVKESLRFMIEKKNHLRYASAVEIYKKGKATLTKGAEIAGVSPDNFRGILNDQGIVTPDTVEWESQGIVRVGKIVKMNPKTIELVDASNASPFGRTVTRVPASMIIGKVAA